MADVDLIPADYAKRKRVRGRIKPMLLGLVAVALVIGSARLALHLLVSLENTNIEQLQKQDHIVAQAKARADEIRQQKQLAEKQLAELDDLRGRDRLKLLLQALDAAHSDSVWLDQLRFVRRDSVAGETTPLAGAGRTGVVVAAKAPAAAAVAVPAGIEQRAEIVGHATSHTKLAEFMRALGSQPGIAEVRLIDTGLGTYANTKVIDLTLVLLVDEKPRKAR